MFLESHYPDINQREMLSIKTSLPEDRIQVNMLHIAHSKCVLFCCYSPIMLELWISLRPWHKSATRPKTRELELCYIAFLSCINHLHHYIDCTTFVCSTVGTLLSLNSDVAMQCSYSVCSVDRAWMNAIWANYFGRDLAFFYCLCSHCKEGQQFTVFSLSE